MGNCISSPSATSNQDTNNQKKGTNKAEETTKTSLPPVQEKQKGFAPTAATDEHGNANIGAEENRNTLEDMDYEGPTTLQEELNEVLEAVYACVTEEDIQMYQSYLQGIEKQQIAEKAAKSLSDAPGFELVDQDNEKVSLSELCKKGPVVLQFYRGKWCPHCNAGLMAYNKYLATIKKLGATFVAISPMLPDGSQFLASKRDLNFAVASDCGNEVARKYKITFTIPEIIRPTFEAWGHDVAKANGDELWEVPLAATYVINKKQEIVWTFVDNDHGVWAEPEDVIDALKNYCGEETSKEGVNTNGKTRGKGSVKAQKPKKTLFGPKKQSAGDYVSGYPN